MRETFPGRRNRKENPFNADQAKVVSVQSAKPAGGAIGDIRSDGGVCAIPGKVAAAVEAGERTGRGRGAF